jgi:hypothetical protein
MLPRCRSAFFVFAALLIVAQQLSAQCTTRWLPGLPVPGVDGTLYAMSLWDRDGPGPAPAVLVAGGGFSAAGAVRCSSIVQYDLTTGAWSALGSGLGFSVRAIAVLPNGDLVVGGVASMGSTTNIGYLARWDGAAWSAFSSSFQGEVRALLVLPNGDLVVGGWFRIGGGAHTGIARWNGTAWSTFGAPMDSGAESLVALPNGDLIASGGFSTVGGVAAWHIARWNGTSWSALGSGLTSGAKTLLVLPNGDLIAGGSFPFAGGVAVNCIARWNGVAWSSLAGGITGSTLNGRDITSLARLPNGNVVASGMFSGIGGTPVGYTAQWDGAAWSAIGTGAGQAHAMLTLPNGELISGGDGGGGIGIARWDGVAWSALCPGARFLVRAMITLQNGDVLASGDFPGALTGSYANSIVRWNGTALQPLVTGMNGPVTALLELPNGDLVAGGWFTDVGGVPCNSIARWNGSSWSPLGTGLNPSPLGASVNALARLPNGDLVAGGMFSLAVGTAVLNVARWNGSSWAPLGSGPGRNVYALTVLPNGDLVAGCNGSGWSSVARWDGTSWFWVGSISGNVYSFSTVGNGDLVAGGSFGIPGVGGVPSAGIARWNGVAWAPLGPPLDGGVYSLLQLANGDLVAGGTFTSVGAVPAKGLARWDGTTWSALDSGTNGYVRAVTRLANGDLLAAGTFSIAGSHVSSSLARLTTTCPAAAASYGVGCTGPAGPITLTATTLPWLGSTFSCSAAGIAPNAIAFGLFGLLPRATPLALLHPAGGVGCNLLLQADATWWLFPDHGTVRSLLAVPNDLALAGVVVHHQVLQAELDASLRVTSLTSSNALAITVGSF